MFNRIRTMRKRWFVVMAAVALLAVGLVSGVAFAANGPARGFDHALRGGPGYSYDADRAGSGGEAQTQLLARVAEILGVKQTDLENAFKTAHHEQADARFADYAAKLASNETITQEQADAAITWFNNRPEEAGRLAFIAVATADTDKMDALLSRMVDAEKLTQEQADAISAWHSERPDTLPEHAGKGFGHGRHGHHDGDHDGHEKGHEDNDSGSEGSAG